MVSQSIRQSVSKSPISRRCPLLLSLGPALVPSCLYPLMLVSPAACALGSVSPAAGVPCSLCPLLLLLVALCSTGRTGSGRVAGRGKSGRVRSGCVASWIGSGCWPWWVESGQVVHGSGQWVWSGRGNPDIGVWPRMLNQKGTRRKCICLWPASSHTL